MITVACVLRSGGPYTFEWVIALKRGLDRHLPSFNFACLTDDESADSRWRIPLRHAWPGWWSKIEMFRPGIFTGRVLYLDLDTLVAGDLSEIATCLSEFAMLADFIHSDRLASGVMAWNADAGAGIYSRFVRDAAAIMARFKRKGDQGFIAEVMPAAERLQPLFPDQIVSYKVHHCRHRIPIHARLVCMHGYPKFQDLPRHDPVRRQWEEAA